MNVQLVKRDIVTAVSCYYITTEFHYAYGGVSISGKTLLDILAEILILLIFSNKNYLPQCHHLHTSMLKGESHVLHNVPRSLCNKLSDV